MKIFIPFHYPIFLELILKSFLFGESVAEVCDIWLFTYASNPNTDVYTHQDSSLMKTLTEESNTNDAWSITCKLLLQCGCLIRK